MHTIQNDFKFVGQPPLQEIEKGHQSLEPLWQQAISQSPGLATGPSISELVERHEISKRSCTIWECIGRQKAPHQGWVYQFRLRDEYKTMNEAFTKAMEKTFPALESGEEGPIADALLFMPKAYKKGLGFLDPRIFSILMELGYRSELISNKELFLYLPDIEALKASWENIRSQDPQFPELKIQSSEGIATHQVFIKALFENHALLSCDKEFIHDHLFHLAPTINLLLSEKDFPEHKAKAVELLNTFYQLCLFGEDLLNDETLTPEEKRDLEIYLPMLWTTLGAWTDTMAAFASLTLFSDLILSLQKDFFYVWSKNEPRWQRYFFSQFGCEPTEELLNKLESTFWKTIVSRLTPGS